MKPASINNKRVIRLFLKPKACKMKIWLFLESKYKETANDNKTNDDRIRKKPRLRNKVLKSTLSFAAFTDSSDKSVIVKPTFKGSSDPLSFSSITFFVIPAGYRIDVAGPKLFPQI